MKLNVERKPESLVVLDITADDDEFAEAMTRAYRKVAKDIQMPGFRKGKAPRNVIERFYGREVFLREAADEVMDKLYRQALEQENITPVGEPDVEINDLEPVNFVVTIPVFPEIQVNDYASVRVEPVDATVEESDVDEVLDRLQKSRGTWVELDEPRSPQAGDQVTVDYEVLAGDEPFQKPVTDAVFVLGETNLLGQLRERLEGMAIGDTESFELAFDDDDETASQEIRGKSLDYKVTLKDIKRRDLPPLDDDFANKINETETLESLRQQIRDDIHVGKTNDGRTGVVNQIINAMAEQAGIDPPTVMVGEEIDHQLNHLKEDLQRSNTPWEGYLRLQGKTEEDLREDFRPEAVRRLRNSLFLQAVAKQETVEATDEDIDAEIARLAPPSPEGADEAVADQAARMAQFYQSDYFRNMLRNELFERKLTERLIEIATEGRGAVLNGWVAPEPVIDADSEVIETEGDVVVDDAVGDETINPEDAAVIEETMALVSKAAGQAGTIGAGADETPAAQTADSEPGTGFAGAVEGDGSRDAPDDYPIKGNADSMIYHTPESGSYANTIAEWHFATEDDAVNAGFRPPANQKRGEATAAGNANEEA
ncbi:MAG: trigger factor [Chloroflexia bacterium]|nr:trigger factor [Chloroflexia bacterium]